MLSVWCMAAAVADIAPPPGYVERCTVARVQRENPGQTCVACDAWHGGREDCEQHEAKGYVRQCKTRGASTWDEVLCKAGTRVVTPDPEPVAPADEPASTVVSEEPASCAPVAPSSGVWPLLGLTVLAWRRRRRGAGRPG